MGLNWPDVDEDEMREWAGHVRQFAKGLTEAHEGTDSLLRNSGEAYDGASYEALLERWGQASTGHMTVLIDGCGVLAAALEVAADAVIVAKGVVIGQLVAMAAELAAAAAAAAVTFGAAAAAEAAIVEVGKRIVNAVLQQIESEIIGRLVSTAVEPFQQAIGNAVSGLVFHGVEAALGDGGGR
ncbi:hypothetical protein [Kitasatospora sp. MMS16-BH015]|uniref:WXG100-like domain-containing protein n=1 Tax=Kitasatospora sp. MMS16-BH015 TaxID=2018025 RepID=UPI00131A4A08|nr:hypothetical protein [Kitasatospora sp. MMS16-BH015]